MYDAKKLENENEDENQSKRFETISDRGYFFNQTQSPLGRTKLSYVPKENLFK
ncbi:hypothetical protein [Clostridium frigidicarnis]|uniref:Uncharacterized protein n=1 Tax=Clostridium frigidicarnis TaxID=84698 RepID=A0A1I0V406_9CLOT|nr:hypothetical protein [Clostridium frigidicarnis]SFA70992.1 hypothetical protein SAMN04488528_1001143 [Clostridium frigidicarnis]